MQTAAIEARDPRTSRQYARVIALLIRWTDEHDIDLDCGDEVEDLLRFVRGDMRWEVHTLTLDTQTELQSQLNSAIRQLVDSSDELANLIVMNYSGHGCHRDPDGLLLQGQVKPSVLKLSMFSDTDELVTLILRVS